MSASNGHGAPAQTRAATGRRRLTLCCVVAMLIPAVANADVEPAGARGPAAAVPGSEDRLISTIARGHHFELAIEDVCGADFPARNRARILAASDRLTVALMARAGMASEQRARLDIEARELAARQLARDPQHVMMLSMYGMMSDAERATSCLTYTNDVVGFWEAYVDRELGASVE